MPETEFGAGKTAFPEDGTNESCRRRLWQNVAEAGFASRWAENCGSAGNTANDGPMHVNTLSRTSLKCKQQTVETINGASSFIHGRDLVVTILQAAYGFGIPNPVLSRSQHFS